MLTNNEIAIMTKYAWSLVGIPYKLGGNVPQDGGMDCSAFCLELMRSIGKVGTSDVNCQMIYSMFNSKLVKVSDKVKEGDFILFGESSDKLSHIAYALDETYMLEAGGTDKTGMIRPRPQTWRKDRVFVIRF
jgi:cell wall-associated NlpC family hydrolase